MRKDTEQPPIGDPLTGRPEDIAQDPSRKRIARLAAAVVIGNRLIANGTPPEDVNRVVQGIIKNYQPRKQLAALLKAAQEIRSGPQIPFKLFTMDWD